MELENGEGIVLNDGIVVWNRTLGLTNKRLLFARALNVATTYFVALAAILPTDSFVGEKIEKSLEPQLATHTTDSELHWSSNLRRNCRRMVWQQSRNPTSSKPELGHNNRHGYPSSLRSKRRKQHNHILKSKRRKSSPATRRTGRSPPHISLHLRSSNRISLTRPTCPGHNRNTGNRRHHPLLPERARFWIKMVSKIEVTANVRDWTVLVNATTALNMDRQSFTADINHFGLNYTARARHPFAIFNTALSILNS